MLKKLCVIGIVLCVAGVAAAQDPNIPDLGVDLPGYIGALGTSLGVVIGAAIALMVAIVTVTMGIRWLRRAGR
jgi:hypothetical protein